MPDYSGALKKFRSGGYPEGQDDSDAGSDDEPKSVRVIKLTDEEAKELAPYQEKFGPGEAMVIEATGKLEGTSFRVMSVKYASGEAPEGSEGPDLNADAKEAMMKTPMMG